MENIHCVLKGSSETESMKCLLINMEICLKPVFIQHIDGWLNQQQTDNRAIYLCVDIYVVLYFILLHCVP